MSNLGKINGRGAFASHVKREGQREAHHDLCNPHNVNVHWMAHRLHSTFGGSGRPCARNAVRKCILATFGRFSTPCFAMNSFAAASTIADAPFGSFKPKSFSN